MDRNVRQTFATSPRIVPTEARQRVTDAHDAGYSDAYFVVAHCGDQRRVPQRLELHVAAIVGCASVR